MSTIKLSNRRKVNVNEVNLEDVITEKNVFLRFFEWLHKHNCVENLTFWLETQNFKYLKGDDIVLQEANRIYEKYFSTPSSSLNVDDPVVLNALEERRKLSDRTLFMGVQNVIWGLLKLDSFSKFRAELGKTMIDKVNTKTLKQLSKIDDDYTIKIYDLFIENNNNFPQMTKIFKPNILPFDDYQEHLHQNLPDIHELWKDRDMMLAFRQFLYEKCTYENLSFYLHAEVFKITPESELATVAAEIYDTYFSPSAPAPLNIDYSSMKKLNEERKKPTKKMFDVISERIFRVLENEWYPLFITSSLYKQLNEETVELKRDRSKTMDNFDLYIEYMNSQKPVKEEEDKVKEEKENRKDNKSDFESESEEKNGKEEKIVKEKEEKISKKDKKKNKRNKD